MGEDSDKSGDELIPDKPQMDRKPMRLHPFHNTHWRIKKIASILVILFAVCIFIFKSKNPNTDIIYNLLSTSNKESTNINSFSNSQSKTETNEEEDMICSPSGAESFARERAGYGLSEIQKVSSLNMGRIRSLGYNSDYGYLIEGRNNYGGLTFITVLISCSNGQYSIDLIEAL